MSETASQNQRHRSVLGLVGAGLIFVSGMIHLFLTPDHFGEARYLGLLFIVNFAGAVVAAFGIYGGHRWGWVLGALVAGGAFVLYVVAGTVGLPGVGREHLISPIGILTKAVEALFLVLCGFRFTRSLTGLKRWALVGGIAAVLLVVPGVALALGPPGVHAGHGGREMAGMTVRWSATSPATHRGDRYTLVVKNTGEEDQRAMIHATIMDHRNHDDTTVVDEPLELAPGEERELTAVNDYGTANHFKTTIASETQDLGLTVTVTDSAGEETARFNQEAFLVREKEAGGQTNGGGSTS